MADSEGIHFRDRTKDKSRNGFEKREKRRRIRKLQDAITQKDEAKVQELLQEEFDVDFQYRGQTALQLAVREGQYDICQMLINKGADVNVCDAERNSVLNISCWNGFINIAELLVRNKANINAQNEQGSTPLIAAAYKGHSSAIDVLAVAKCDLDIPNVNGQSALHVAVRQHHVDIVSKLTSAGCNIDTIDTDFKSPLMLACELGYLDIVTILLKKGASVDLKDRTGETAVLMASTQGQDDILRELATHNADVNLTTINGRVPLLEAITGGHWKSATVLIQSGCNVDMADKHKQAPIHAAVRQVSNVFGKDLDKEGMDVVKKLIARGCDINKQDSQGWTPLYQSAYAGNLELSELMLKNNTDVSIVTGLGDTVLHAGVYGNNEKAVDMLISNGCDVNSTNKKGEHPLFSAILSRVNLEIIRSLVRAGSSLDLKENSLQLTSLHEALIQHYTEAAIMLIEAGCDVNAKNIKGQTPLYTACEKGNQEIVCRLLNIPSINIEGTKASTIPIHIATTHDFSHIVQLLISAGCDMNVVNEKGLTPIMLAAQENSTRVAKVLIRNGCDIEAHCKVKRLMACCVMHEDRHPHFDLEPLFLAVTHKNFNLIKIIVQCYRNPPYKVIKVLSNILRTAHELNIHIAPEEKKDILDFFSYTVKYPRLLQEICRCQIRDRIGCNIDKKVEKLPIANKIKDYLLMDEILQIEDEADEEEELKHAGKFTFVGRKMPYQL